MRWLVALPLGAAAFCVHVAWVEPRQRWVPLFIGAVNAIGAGLYIVLGKGVYW